MRFKLDFDMDNAAFDHDAYGEASRLLQKVAQQVDLAVTRAPILDRNGNSIGSYKIVHAHEAIRKAVASRMKTTTPERRSEIARQAALARWKR